MTAREDDESQELLTLLGVLMALRRGDLDVRLPRDRRGLVGKVFDVFNDLIDLDQRFVSRFSQLCEQVGKDGRLDQRLELDLAAGPWRGVASGVNGLITDLTRQTVAVGRVIAAVARGDLSHAMADELEGRAFVGDFLRTVQLVNLMVDQLRAVASEVTRVAREVGSEGKLGGQASVPGAVGVWRELTDKVNQLAANLTAQVRAMAEVATAVTAGDLSRSISIEVPGEVGVLKDNVNQMIANLRDTTRKNTEQDWLKTNLTRFTRMLQGQRDREALARSILRELASLVNVHHGVFYVMDQGVLRLLAGYAYRERKNLANVFHLGEGLVGQCALERERILLTEVPADYITISSGLGEAAPLNIIVLPVVFEDEVKAVIELASFHHFRDVHLALLDQLTESIGVVFNMIAASARTEELLKQSQSLAEELRSQQRELTETNRRLEQQARSLQASEERLRQQQDELQRTNAELEQRSALLQQQNAEVERKNRQIEQAKLDLEERAQQLAQSSKYKSEFLANMSHELRTPLNSLLILAQLLAENPDHNLSAKQVEFARTIHGAGTDLLTMISDILDLAKIESGTMDVDNDTVDLVGVRDQVESSFRQLAEAKGLEFAATVDPAIREPLFTDRRRLQQVLKNLLSNAFKFTEKGRVELKIEPARAGVDTSNGALAHAEGVISFSVADTGIGVPLDKQKIIFEAFQQADGTTSRKYGGTGLGLSISRELAHLLGGEIRIASNPGVGSTFTLYLPKTHVPDKVPAEHGPTDMSHGIHDAQLTQLTPLTQPTPSPPSPPPTSSTPPTSSLPAPPSTPPTSSTPSTPAPPPPTPPPLVLTAPLSPVPGEVFDDRDDIQPGDRTLLIVEDDRNFARLLLDMAREKGFKGVVATRGDTGLALARELRPDAITLDLVLPGMDGWSVLERLKHDVHTRHIPVHLISGADEAARPRAIKQGALAFVQKPVSKDALAAALAGVKSFVERHVRNLLVVEADEAQRAAIVELVGAGDGDVATTAVCCPADALTQLQGRHFDCMVLGLDHPDPAGRDLIKTVKADEHLRDLPIIVYAGSDLGHDEEAELGRLTEAVIVKSARSREHLLDETALFLHRVRGEGSPGNQAGAPRTSAEDPVFAGKRILVVDDDVRNIFALASVLERHKMEVIYAENGRKGIELLRAHPDVSAVLMDVLMPEMNGYETTREIRKDPRFVSLPIITLTAKAMKGDRERCLEAGASDYITKPVEPDKLLSLLRVWLSG